MATLVVLFIYVFLENDFFDDKYVFGADAGAMIAFKQTSAPAAAPFLRWEFIVRLAWQKAMGEEGVRFVFGLSPGLVKRRIE